DTYLSVGSPIQIAAPALLERRHNLQALLLDRLRVNLHTLDAQLARQTACGRLQVDGGWYAVLRVPAIQTDEELAIRLLTEGSVLVHPGHFYDFPRDGYLIVSLITQPEIFRAGIERLLDCVNEWSGVKPK
nr:pyridoxal phosphate-dependent aminotransferase [Terriglobales bacterium]